MFWRSPLRADNKGAVGYIGGSNNTYWDEDYWWGVGNGTTPPTSNPTYAQTGLGFSIVFGTKMENSKQIGLLAKGK